MQPIIGDHPPLFDLAARETESQNSRPLMSALGSVPLQASWILQGSPASLNFFLF